MRDYDANADGENTMNGTPTEPTGQETAPQGTDTQTPKPQTSGMSDGDAKLLKDLMGWKDKYAELKSQFGQAKAALTEAETKAAQADQYRAVADEAAGKFAESMTLVERFKAQVEEQSAVLSTMYEARTANLGDEAKALLADLPPGMSIPQRLAFVEKHQSMFGASGGSGPRPPTPPAHQSSNQTQRPESPEKAIADEYVKTGRHERGERAHLKKRFFDALWPIK